MKKILIFIFLISFPVSAFADFNTDLFYGSSSLDVSNMQQFLKDNGYFEGPVTGNFYTKTEEAVKNFQRTYGIIPSAGYWGPKTREIANRISKIVVSTVDSRNKSTESRINNDNLLREINPTSLLAQASQDTTPPSAPTNVTAIPSSGSSIYVSWSPSTDNVGVKGYNYYKFDGTANLFQGYTTATFTNYSSTPGVPVTIKIRTLDTSDNRSDYSAAVTATIPVVTTGASSVTFSADSTNISPGQSATLTWNASNVYACNATAGPSSWLGYKLLSGSFNTGPLYSDTTYILVCSKSTATYTRTVNILVGSTQDTESPSTPTGLSASSVTSSSFTLSWSASSDNVGVTGYRVYRNGTLISSPSQTSVSITGLSASTAYSMTVSAVDAAGNASSQSSTLSVTTSSAPDTQAPSTPNGLSASSVTSSSFTLSWSASSDNVGVTGYRVYRNGTLISSPSQTSVSITGLSASTAYSMTVSAVDAAGNASSQSSTLSVTTSSAPDTQAPSTPGGLSGSATANTISLVWNASFDTGGSGLRGYYVYKNGSLTPLNSTPITATTYTDTSLNSSTLYSYSVSAVDNASNQSARSSVISVTTLAAPDTSAPSIPQNVSAVVNSATQITISWSASTDNVAVAGYRVYRGGTQIATVTSGTTFSNSGLTPSTSYSYSVYAYDAAGNTSAQSNTAVGTTLAALDTQAPSVPQNVSANAVSSSQINISWSPATDNVGVVNYKVFRDGVQVGLVSTTNYSSINLMPNVQYSYRVSALDLAGNESSQSTVISATTLSLPDTTPPSVPTNIVSTTNSATQITISWSASTDNVAVAGYRVYRGGVFLANVPSGTTYVDSGLTPSTSYSYRVLAYDSSGNQSAQSLSSISTTLASTPIDNIPPSIPANISGTANSRSTASISWQASTDNVSVIGYTIMQNGVVVGTTTSLRFEAEGLLAGTTYSYSIRAFDSSSNFSLPAIITVTTLPASTQTTSTTGGGGGGGGGGDFIAPSQARGVEAVRGDASVKISWIRPLESDFAAIRILRKTGSYSLSKDDGVLVYDGKDETSIFDRGLINGTLYYYSIYSRDTTGNYSIPVTLTIDPQQNVNMASSTPTVGINFPTRFEPRVILLPGSNDSSVTELQTILSSDSTIYPEKAITGIYDESTRRAVERFQVKYGIVSSGTPDTTGYGAVGPRTREIINNVFLTKTIPVNTQFSVQNPTLGTQGSVSSDTVPSKTLVPGETSEDVYKLQKYLNSSGYTIAIAGPGSPSNETRFYGAATRSAVTKFQKANGINESGIVDSATLSKMLELKGIRNNINTPSLGVQTFNRSLSIGSTGDDVKALQVFLNSNGFMVSQSGPGSPGNETTFFGIGTSNAVKKFQEAYRQEILTPNLLTNGNGLVGPSTRKKINEIIEKKSN